jgi:hypothetical protein
MTMVPVACENKILPAISTVPACQFPPCGTIGNIFVLPLTEHEQCALSGAGWRWIAMLYI